MCLHKYFNRHIDIRTLWTIVENILNIKTIHDYI